MRAHPAGKGLSEGTLGFGTNISADYADVADVKSEG